MSAMLKWLKRSLLWRVWKRLLEVEFVDRSVAIAGKAFVSFFPFVIVLVAFVPEGIRESIITTLTLRLGFEGDARELAVQAFASSEQTRQATGLLGLLMTIFFTTSFTTALQRVYLRAWRRTPISPAGKYWRGGSWVVAMIVCMATIGGLRSILPSGTGDIVFAVASIVLTTALWTFTAGLLLEGAVAPRVLLPTGIVTSLMLGVYAASATVWMPRVLTSNEAQFGVFGVALALVTWFSGAGICVLVGACAGAILAEDTGWIGRVVRGRQGSITPIAAPAAASGDVDPDEPDQLLDDPADDARSSPRPQAS